MSSALTFPLVRLHQQPIHKLRMFRYTYAVLPLYTHLHPNLLRIVANANGCLSLNSGYNPTFVLLDFVDQGQAIAAASHLNGLS